MAFNFTGIVVGLLIVGFQLEGQQPWPKVSALKPGTRVAVWGKDGMRYKGEIERVMHEQMSNAVNDSMALRAGGKSVSLSQTNIHKVVDLSRGHRWRNIAIGAGIGLAAGAILDQTAGTRYINEGRDIRAVLYVAPIAIGAGIGALFAGHPTIYRQ